MPRHLSWLATWLVCPQLGLASYNVAGMDWISKLRKVSARDFKESSVKRGVGAGWATVPAVPVSNSRNEKRHIAIVFLERKAGSASRRPCAEGLNPVALSPLADVSK